MRAKVVAVLLFLVATSIPLFAAASCDPLEEESLQLELVSVRKDGVESQTPAAYAQYRFHVKVVTEAEFLFFATDDKEHYVIESYTLQSE